MTVRHSSEWTRLERVLDYTAYLLMSRRYFLTELRFLLEQCISPCNVILVTFRAAGMFPPHFQMLLCMICLVSLAQKAQFFRTVVLARLLLSCISRALT